ncbi:hypothetical protein SDC9_37180 [bioreactor metagenome]|uniref:BACON domain-containing protein n=1 Tax=bioreactor metagenome TaxID=1076179 RepID=A0A644VIQ4_9ZZZZ|nr:BACON domain-containing protein [Paludibacter sp.]
MNYQTQKITKIKWITVCLSIACIFQMSSCKEESIDAAYFVLVDDNNGTYVRDISIYPNGGVRTFTLVSNRDWEISYDEMPWIEISPTSGHGVSTISITTTPNESLDEDSIYVSIKNNTLLVIDKLKVKRRNYLATYKGNISVSSPIEGICTTCSPPSSNVTDIAAISVLDSVNNKITLNFSATFRLSKSFTMDLKFEGNMQTVTENQEVKFVYRGVGTFDLTPLGEIINDPSVSGVKNTVIEAELKGGLLTFQAVIDPGADGSVTQNVSTLITFEGNR